MEKQNSKLYTKDSIESLNPLEFTRLRPQVYAGDCTYSTQLLVEVISNSVDEVRNGFGNKIDIILSKNDKNQNVITVRDYGQGFIPNSFREDGKTILEAAFSVLNTSGKFREDGTYGGTSLGSFGIGAKITNFLSHQLIVSTCRDGKVEKITFEEGIFKTREKIDKQWYSDTSKSGTTVSWIPSEEFFTHTEVEISKIKSLLRTIVCLCPGLTIFLNNNGETGEYYSKNGLNDLVDDAVKNKEIINNRFILNYINNKNKIDMVMTYTNNYSPSIVAYVNAGLTEAGPHITQIKTIITREFNKFFREKGWLKEKEDNLTGDDINEGMYLVFNIVAPNVGYDAQVKSRITKIDMTPFTTEIAEALQTWFRYNEKEIKSIVDKALLARKAREAAKKAKEAVRQPKEKGLKAKMSISDKFIDCSSKNPAERKLFILEGVSAGSAAVEARNPKTDCIYLLKGKIIAPIKTEVSKILANQEMSDLIQIIGGGFGENFNLSKMNFDKIVIFSDSDAE